MLPGNCRLNYHLAKIYFLEQSLGLVENILGNMVYYLIPDLSLKHLEVGNILKFLSIMGMIDSTIVGGVGML